MSSLWMWTFTKLLSLTHSHPFKAHSILQQGWIVWDRKVPNKLEMKTITPASRTHLRNHLTSIYMKVHARCACVVSAVYTRMLHVIRVENTFNVQWCPRALYLMNSLNLSSALEQCGERRIVRAEVFWDLLVKVVGIFVFTCTGEC